MNVMIKGKFLKSHPAFSYFEGEIGFVPADKADRLVREGFFLPIPDTIVSEVEKNQPSSNPLPADLPAREKLFESGYKTLAEIKAADDALLEVPGISNAVLKKIKKYLEKFVFE